MPNKIVQVKDQWTKEALEFIVLRPIRAYGLTDDEANCLYSIWQSAPRGAKQFEPKGNREAILSLKTKGYVAGGLGTLQLTDKGRKVIVEMATHEPNALDKGRMPTYSEIKASKNARSRQTFTRKGRKTAASPGANDKPFNLARIRAEAAWGDLPGAMLQRYVTNPAGAWWAKKKDQFQNFMGGITGSGCIAIYEGLKGRAALSDAAITKAEARAKGPAGLSPAELMADPNFAYLVKQMQAFYTATGKDPATIPQPGNFLSESIPGMMDASSFANFKKRFNHAASIVTRDECIRFERAKGVATPPPTAAPTRMMPADVSLIMALKSSLVPLHTVAPTKVTQITTELDSGSLLGQPIQDRLAKAMEKVTDESQVPVAAWQVSKDIDQMFKDMEAEWQATNPLAPAADRNKMLRQVHKSRDEAMKAIIPALASRFKLMSRQWAGGKP